MAIVEPVGTNSFHNDISQQLLNDGSSIADRLKAQFVTTTNSSMNKSDYFFTKIYIMQIISFSMTIYLNIYHYF